MLYTSLDYHRSFSCITTMNDKGEIVGRKKLPSNGEIVDSATVTHLLRTNLLPFNVDNHFTFNDDGTAQDLHAQSFYL